MHLLNSVNYYEGFDFLGSDCPLFWDWLKLPSLLIPLEVSELLWGLAVVEFSFLIGCDEAEASLFLSVSLLTSPAII